MENTRKEFERMKPSIMKAKDCTKCVNCGSDENIQLHHVVPLVLGGTNNIDNIVPLCEDCHSKIHGWTTKTSAIKAGKELQKQRGEYLGGRIPIGYTVEGKRLKICASTKCIITNLFNIYLSSGCNMCIKYLLENGINKDSNEEVLHILKNRIYIGYPYSNSNIYLPELQIIDTDLFYAVQEKIESKGFNKRNRSVITSKSNSVLEGLCFSYCNKKMNIDYNRGVKIFRSRCKCKDHQKTFNYERIEQNILDMIFSLDYIDMSREEYEQLSILEKKLFIQDLTTRIIVRGYDDIEIIYNKSNNLQII